MAGRRVDSLIERLARAKAAPENPVLPRNIIVPGTGTEYALD